jgi:hypothetical protein
MFSCPWAVEYDSAGAGGGGPAPKPWRLFEEPRLGRVLLATLLRELALYVLIEDGGY